ncbi:MAG: hypothetical protein R2777_10790 [Chitinophagales bacterium]
MVKHSFFLTLTVLFFFITSCKKNEIIQSQDEELEIQSSQPSFKFEDCKKLTVGNFYALYCVQSNTESDVVNTMALKPQILVEKHNLNSSFISELENTEEANPDYKEIDMSDGSVELIKEHNIPTGYKMTLFYANPYAVPSKSWGNKYFTDSGAKGITVSCASGYEVPVSFYSKGGFWGWKYRGMRTISPWNTCSHTFLTSKYTNKIGARMKAYTTTNAWNALSKSFVY